MKIWNLVFKGADEKQEEYLRKVYNELKFLGLDENREPIDIFLEPDISKGESIFHKSAIDITKIPDWQKGKIDAGSIYKTRAKFYIETHPNKIIIYGKPLNYHLRLGVTDILQYLTDDFIFLHASSVSDGESATLLAGKTRCGKTRKCLEMLKQGYKILSEDVSIVDKKFSKVYPYNADAPVSANDIELFNLSYIDYAGGDRWIVPLKKHFQHDDKPRKIGDIISIDGTTLEESILKYRNWAEEVISGK